MTPSPCPEPSFGLHRVSYGARCWGDTQLKLNLGRLVDLEHVPLHRVRHSRSVEYEQLYDGAGQDGSPFVNGLIDVDAERAGSERERAGPKRERAGIERGSDAVASCSRPTTGRSLDTMSEALRM